MIQRLGLTSFGPEINATGRPDYTLGNTFPGAGYPTRRNPQIHGYSYSFLAERAVHIDKQGVIVPFNLLLLISRVRTDSSASDRGRQGEGEPPRPRASSSRWERRLLATCAPWV